MDEQKVSINDVKSDFLADKFADITAYSRQITVDISLYMKDNRVHVTLNIPQEVDEDYEHYLELNKDVEISLDEACRLFGIDPDEKIFDIA